MRKRPLIDAVFLNSPGQTAAYIRVSSRSQDLSSQQDAIARAARARGDQITRWYCERASARRLDRPELNDLLGDARAGNLQVLWVFKLDRLSRSGIRDTLNLLQELKTCGCQVKSVADGFSLDGPAADVILAVLAWAAQMERAAIGDRVAAARVQREARGLSWGRPSRLSLEQQARIEALALEGQSIRTIAQAVGVPRSTVGRFLVGRVPKNQRKPEV